MTPADNNNNRPAQPGLTPEKRTPSELARELAEKKARWYSEVHGWTFDIEAFESTIAETLAPLLEEIDAARKMRDEFLFSDQGDERPMYILDDPESLYCYDAIRKKNEGGLKD